ncbi:MAG TPA: hypothetical protein VFF79_01705 [Conexibacter sp.]|nr:hypothetical protein [Conexibacter sp.]
MKIAVEESGFFRCRDNAFEASVLCGLIVPDSLTATVRGFTAEMRERWNKPELKASRLRPGQILEVAEFLAAHPIAAVVYVSDTTMTTRAAVARQRIGQAAEFLRARQRLAADHPADPRLSEIDQVIDMVAGCSTERRMSDDDFIQSQQLPELILECVSRACGRYWLPEWEPDFERFEIVLDRKLPGDLKAGERYVHEHLERLLGSSRRFAIELPPPWRHQPRHPFRKHFDSPDGEYTMLDSLLGSRRWVDSRDDDCVQLADIIAGTVRRTIEKGLRSSRRQAFETLRLVMADEHGWCFHFYRYRDAPDPDLRRYLPLLRAWPQEPRFTRRVGGVLVA